MIHYCTYCDHTYLPRALAMVESLERHCGPFTLWLLALSDECHRLVAQLGRPTIRSVPLSALEAADSRLAEAKANRSRIEYYFTLSPCWPLHLLKTHADIDTITYLDSDLYFFSSPDPIFAELEQASVGIIPHRFPPATEATELRHGRYNVGWITWKHDACGLACLEDWRERCLEWCYDRCEDGKFADQGYLDAWPTQFQRVHVIGHPGANVAIYNVARHDIRHLAGRLCSDGQPLIFYHFHGVAGFDEVHAITNLERAVASWRQRRWLACTLYRPYLRAVARAFNRLRRLGHDGEMLRAPRLVPHGAHTSAANRPSLAGRLNVAAQVLSGRLVRYGRG